MFYRTGMVMLGFCALMIVAVFIMGTASLYKLSKIEDCPSGQVHILARNGTYCVDGSPATYR